MYAENQWQSVFKNISVSLYIYEDCGTWRAGEAQTSQDVRDSKQLVIVDPIEGSGKKEVLHNLRQAAPNSFHSFIFYGLFDAVNTHIRIRWLKIISS